jgi:hypothetical protein
MRHTADSHFVSQCSVAAALPSTSQFTRDTRSLFRVSFQALGERPLAIPLAWQRAINRMRWFIGFWQCINPVLLRPANFVPDLHVALSRCDSRQTRSRGSSRAIWISRKIVIPQQCWLVCLSGEKGSRYPTKRPSSVEDEPALRVSAARLGSDQFAAGIAACAGCGRGGHRTARIGASNRGHRLRALQTISLCLLPRQWSRRAVDSRRCDTAIR